MEPDFAQALTMGLARSLTAAGGAWLAAHAGGSDAATYSGALLVLGSAAFTILDKFVVKAKIATALNTPVPAQGGPK